MFLQFQAVGNCEGKLLDIHQKADFVDILTLLCAFYYCPGSVKRCQDSFHWVISTCIHIHDVSCDSLDCVLHLSLSSCQRKSPLLSLALPLQTCAAAYTWDTSRCAAQQCANMKRHIRVIGALPARVAQHNQHLRRFTGSAIQVQRGRRESERREAIRAMPSLSTAQRASQELSGNLFQLARYEVLSEKSPHTITPSYTRVT